MIISEVTEVCMNVSADHAVVSPKSCKLDFPGVKRQLCCVA